MGVVLESLVKKGSGSTDFLKQTGNLHCGHFGDSDFKQLPCLPSLLPTEPSIAPSQQEQNEILPADTIHWVLWPCAHKRPREEFPKTLDPNPKSDTV